MMRDSLSDFHDISAMLGCGVYALYYRGQLVYIGKSKRLFARIAAHRQQWERFRKLGEIQSEFHSAKAIRFDKVMVRLVPPDELDYVERELISRFKPPKNDYLVKDGRRLTLADIGITASPPPRAVLGLERRV